MYITTILSLLSYFYDLQKVHKGSRGRKFIYYTIYGRRQGIWFCDNGDNVAV